MALRSWFSDYPNLAPRQGNKVAAMHDAVMRGLVGALVAKVGGVDAAAAIFDAHFGAGHKGTVSKIMAGQLRISAEAVIALENAAAEFPITRMMGARLAVQSATGGDIADLTAQSVEMVGLAHGSIIRALSDGSDGGVLITRSEAGAIIANMRRQMALAERIIAELQRGDHA